MKKPMMLLLLLVLFINQACGALPAHALELAARVPYTQFVARFHAFLAEERNVESIDFKASVKKAGKDGRMPFTITGSESKLTGSLVGDQGDGGFSDKESGLVDSVTIELKYPGDVFPVLAAISALGSISMTNTAYRHINPDDDGWFDIPNYRVSILKKSKNGLASQVSFEYAADARADATLSPAPSAYDISVPSSDAIAVDVKGFFQRVNLFGRTVHANMFNAKFTDYKAKMGKTGEDGLAPFAAKLSNKFVTNTYEGLARDGIIETLTFRHEAKQFGLNRLYFVFELLYAINGASNTSGLLSYDELERVAYPFGGHLQTQWVVMNHQLDNLEVSAADLKTYLEANSINGYQVAYNESEDGRNIEYVFTLLPVFAP